MTNPTLIERLTAYVAQFDDGQGNNQPAAEALIREAITALSSPPSLDLRTMQEEARVDVKC